MADGKAMARLSRSYSTQNDSSLFKMFERIGNHLTSKDVILLTILAGRNCSMENSSARDIKTGQDFFHAMHKSGSCDESNLSSIIHFLKMIRRHDLLHMIHLRKKIKVTLDPVEEYLKTISQVPHKTDPSCSDSNQVLRLTGRDKFSEPGPSTSSDDRISFPGGELPTAKKLRRSQRLSKRSTTDCEAGGTFDTATGLRRKFVCDVRLRVRAEYCNYEAALLRSVSSNKADPVERQLECFTQASAILRSRDLGYIICDIKFSEITYLDAFWRDYLNGSLLEALKGVFITDTLKQAVGNEAIKLLVVVEESDYEKGRSILLQNLHQSI